MNDIIITTEAEELVVNGEAMLVSNGTCSVESANMGIPMESGKDPFKRSLIVIIAVHLEFTIQLSSLSLWDVMAVCMVLLPQHSNRDMHDFT